jgi:small subunit ribosomal protein S20
MANHPSALKRMRQNERRKLRNQAYRSRVKTAVKNYLKAAQNGSEDTRELLSQASSLIQRGVTKGIFHKNNASRTIGRLSKRLPS